LELSTRNTNFPLVPTVTVNGVISDGPGATLALTAGFAPDSENHRGVVTVTGANSYTGPTIVNGVELEFNSIGNVNTSGTEPANALGLPTSVADGTIRLGAIDGSSGVRVAGTLRYIGSVDAQTDRQIRIEGDGGILDSADGAGSVTFAGDIFSDNAAILPILQLHGNGDHEISGDIYENGTIVRVVKINDGTWKLSGNNSYTGTTIINAGRMIVDSDSLPATGGVANNGELEFNQTSAFGTYSGQISGAGDLIKSGGAPIELTAANSYSGDTTINQGQLSVRQLADAGSPSGIGVGQTVFLSGDGGRLRYTGTTAASTNRDFVVTPGFGQPRIISFSEALTLTGTISGSGGAFMEFQGSIKVTGTNTYSATTNVQTSSTLIIPQITDTGVAGPLGTGDTIFIGPNATLRFTGESGATNREIVLTSTVDVDETIEVSIGELVLSGNIVAGDGVSRLVKADTGTLIVTGDNTYQNDTDILGGTLVVNNTTGSGTGTGDVSVGGMARLSGNGSIAGNVLVGALATVDPGTSTGTLTVGGDVTFSSISELVIEIAGRDAGEFDLLDVGGTADVEGFLTVDLENGFIPATSDEFTIVNAGVLNGGFSGLLQGGRVSSGAGEEGTFFVDIDYQNDVVILNDFQLNNQGLGDYNNDSTVNIADYTVWRDNLGATVSLPNRISSGVVNENDYTVWKNNFGNSTASSAALTESSVPEPATAAPLLLALSALVTRRLWR
ncbi:MAG: autotransporter-associated beta strand repeat-containing protein, partial [Aeoliella sp.]